MGHDDYGSDYDDYGNDGDDENDDYGDDVCDTVIVRSGFHAQDKTNSSKDEFFHSRSMTLESESKDGNVDCRCVDISSISMGIPIAN